MSPCACDIAYEDYTSAARARLRARMREANKRRRSQAYGDGNARRAGRVERSASDARSRGCEASHGTSATEDTTSNAEREDGERNRKLLALEQGRNHCMPLISCARATPAAAGRIRFAARTNNRSLMSPILTKLVGFCQ